jgi:predicted enzyme related to lactoylglutathione lyase
MPFMECQLMRLELYIAVTDMNRALAFYRELFGREPVQNSDRYSAFDVGGVRFGLLSASAYAHPLVVGNNCMPNIQVEDVDAERERVRRIASTITEVQAVGPFRLFMFADPDGNVLECYSVEKIPPRS